MLNQRTTTIDQFSGKMMAKVAAAVAMQLLFLTSIILPSVSYALLLLPSSSSSSFGGGSASSSSQRRSSSFVGNKSSWSSLRNNPDTTIMPSTTYPNSMSAFRRSDGSSSTSFTVTVTTTVTTVRQQQQSQQQQQQQQYTQKERTSGRHFQLEELEDAETCTTDIILHDDYSITLGITNGPRYIVEESTGSWSTDLQSTLLGDSNSIAAAGHNSNSNISQRFQMTLKRVYPAGDNSNNDNGGGSGTDWYTNTKSNIGKFTYIVERQYIGECFVVGGCVLAMNGDIIIDTTTHHGGQMKVGYFNMIDTTEERIANSMDVSLA